MQTMEPREGTEAHLLHVRHTRRARNRRWPRVHINDHDTIPPRLGCPPSPQLGGIPPQQLQSRGKLNLDIRERALSHKHALADRRWTEHTKSLPPMAVGTHVHIQNQTGPRPNKWDKTGVVVEVLDFHQYAVRVDGSGRQTIRNRHFFVTARQQSPRHTAREDVQTLSPTTPAPSGSHTSTHIMSHPLPPLPPAPPVDVAAPPTLLSDSDTETHSPTAPSTAPSSSPDAVKSPTPPPTRRSTRNRRKPDWLGSSVTNTTSKPSASRASPPALPDLRPQWSSSYRAAYYPERVAAKMEYPLLSLQQSFAVRISAILSARKWKSSVL